MKFFWIKQQSVTFGAAALVLAIAGRDAFAQEGLSSFRQIAEPTTSAPASILWEPVSAPMLSLVNVAPVLLPFVNTAPAFGIPGTVVGGFWERTQVTGDWGGVRTDLARNGFFLDVYTTSVYQNVTSGGIETGDAFWNSTQISLNIDTGRAGLWPGGLIHLNVQARNGEGLDDTFTVGSYVPQVLGLLLPAPTFSNDIYPSDYYLVQAFGKHVAVLAGVINGLTMEDQTMFGDSYRYAFTNFNFNKNPFFANFYQPAALSVLGVWSPSKSFTLEGGVLDPDTTPDFANPVFKHVNLYWQATVSYSIAGLPGNAAVLGTWTNKPKLDLASPPNFKKESWFEAANFSQYLYLIEDSTSIPQKLKSGQPLRGIGVFGRLGYAPDNTNPVARHASLALYGYGLLDARKYDSFGVGYYWNGTSSDLRDTLERVTLNKFHLEDEKGLEVFYDFAVTPAIRLIASYQYIWDPLVTQVKTRQDHAGAFLLRTTVAF